MKQSKRRPSIFFNIILFLGLVGIWIAFAPARIGGQTSYVMVSGISMEPGYHSGDLVILRKAKTYKAGDVATYRDAVIGVYVIHRIIGIDQGRFVLKGDNNSWIDAYHPAPDEVLGKQWIHAPKLGLAMQWLRKPINLSLTIVLLGGVFMTSMISKSPKGQKAKPRQSNNSRGMLEATFYLLGLLFVGFLGLSIFAFTRPLTRTADKIPYQQESNYFYSAAGTPGVYDTDVVRTGEPVFPALTCFLNIGLTYNILGGQFQNISGSHQMYARIMDEPSGWQRTLPLIPQTAFTGSSYFSMVSLDLCQLTALVNMVETETGLHTNTYTVEIITNIAFTASAPGRVITDTLDPILTFKFDKVHFYLATDGSGVDPLHFSKAGLAESSYLQANKMNLLGWEPAIEMLRAISLAGFGMSLSILMVAGWYFSNNSQDEIIRLKHGDLLMDVDEQSLGPISPVVDVSSINDLVKFAERQNTMVLHVADGPYHKYFVQNNKVTYRYTLSGDENSIANAKAFKNEQPRYGMRPGEYRGPDTASASKEML